MPNATSIATNRARCPNTGRYCWPSTAVWQPSRCNRPRQRNAVGDGMREELADAYRSCDRDDDVRVIVLTGAPPAFCAGADLGEGEDTFAEPEAGFTAAGIDVPAWTLSKPVIAAVNGHAIGLGLTLASAVRHPVLRRRRAVRRRPGAARRRRRRLLALGPAAPGRDRQRRRNPVDRSDIRRPRAVELGSGQPRARRRRGAPRGAERWRTTSPRTPRRCRLRPASDCCGNRSTSTAPPLAVARPRSTWR